MKKAINYLRHKIGLPSFLLVVPVILTGGLPLSIFSQTGDFLPVPENFQVEGIPPIKNADISNLFPDSATIGSNLIWDVDRKNGRMLVTDQTNNIYVLDKPLAKPVKLIEKTVPAAVKTNPRGDSLAFTNDEEDADNFRLYLYDFAAKTVKKLARQCHIRFSEAFPHNSFS